MTKKTLQLLATAALVAGFGLTTVTANAADTTGTTGTTGSQETTATATLKAGDGSGNGNGDGGNLAGAVALTSAPSITFGAGENATDNVFNGTKALDVDGTFVKSESSQNKDASEKAVTVVDPGVAKGWNVSVSNTAFLNTNKSATGAAKEIVGGTLTLTQAKVSGGEGATVGNPAELNGDTVTLNTSDDKSTNDEDTVSTDKVFHAAEGAGAGTWAAVFGGANLHVPSGNVQGDYTSTLTWTLGNAPE